MAVRLLTIDELEARLRDLGCNSVRGWRDNGRLWKARDGRYFMVPMPELPPAEEDPTNDPLNCRFPDWQLDDLIEKHALDRRGG